MKKVIYLLMVIQLFSCIKEPEEIADNNANGDSLHFDAADCDTLLVNTISDQELYDTIYSAFQYYDGFYSEDLDGGSIYFENRISVYKESEPIFLCTNDPETAHQWSEMSSNNSAYYRELVSTSQNEKYFEFRRVNPANSSDILLSRVLKCSFLDCSNMETIDQYNKIIGTFNQVPRTISNCQELIEFWNYFHSYQIGGMKFISSEVCETSTYIYIVLFETEVVYGDWGLHDKISLIKNTSRIDKDSGVIYVSKTVLKEIDGRLN